MASNTDKFSFDDVIMIFTHAGETGSISASGGESTEEQAFEVYRQKSNITRTKYQNLAVSCLVLQLSLPNLLTPCVKLRMKM